MRWSTVIALTIGMASVCGCRTAVDESPLVASVYDHELHQSDLVGLVGEGTSREDSASIVSNYVDQWIRQTVMLAKAEKNVSDNFERQLEEYHRSLLTYAYEQQIVNQLLDTVVTEAQIAEYYDGHQDEFQLKNSIVKAVYVMAPRKSPVDSKIKAIIGRHSFQESDVVDLEEFATRNGLQGYYDANAWIPFYTLQTAVPITTYNENLYLKQNRSITLQDDSTAYYIRILDYKVNDEVSPLELQSENIKAIIINHRKTEILANLQADLLKEAEEGGHVVKITR